MLKNPKLALSLLTISIVWGTTFLAIRIAVETIPGWFVAGIRQFLAAVILLFILLFSKKFRWIGWKNIGYQFLFAFLMLVMANGLTTIAEENISSSLASLITSSSPILVFLGSVIIGLQKFSLRSLLGVLICFCGILFIFWNGLEDLSNPDYRIGVFLMFCAISAWTIGTLFTKKLNLQSGNIMLNLFYQFLFAGIIQIIFAFIFSEKYQFEDWSARSILAMLYLAIFGSVITFFAYYYALNRITAVQVSAITYINTIIAIFLGWLILDEEISLKFLIAAILIIFGVFILNYKPKERKTEYS